MQGEKPSPGRPWRNFFQIFSQDRHMAFWDGWGEEGGIWGNLDTTLIVVDDRIGISV